jgi:uncharacterized coiled-coil protein SlyX
MARLSRVEQDSGEFKRTLAQIANILVDLNDRVDGLGARVDRLGEQLGSRLDRLIAVTIQERTYSFERLGDIERRLSRLEKHAGF